LKCSGTATNCTVCTNINTVYYYLSATTNTCVTTCPAGQFIDTTKVNKCSLCATGCALCTVNSVTCTKCTNAGNVIYYLTFGLSICSTVCPDGQYISITTSNQC
jgi:hypothetical protein